MPTKMLIDVRVYVNVELHSNRTSAYEDKVNIFFERVLCYCVTPIMSKMHFCNIVVPKNEVVLEPSD
jgi:hypothetical protein